MARRKKRRFLSYWYIRRYDTLLLEGFTPEEAVVISNVRISTPQMRRLRRRRKKMLQRYVDRGLPLRQAIESVRTDVRGSDVEIIDWDKLRTVLYPEDRPYVI